MKDSSILDQQFSEQQSSAISILTIGSAIFIWLAIAGYSYLIDTIIRDVMISQSMTPQAIYLFAEISYLIIFTLSWYIIIKKFTNPLHNIKLEKLFPHAILAYLIAQAFQFAYPFLQPTPENLNTESLNAYYDYLGSPQISILNPLLSYLKYFLFGLIIWRNRAK